MSIPNHLLAQMQAEFNTVDRIITAFIVNPPIELFPGSFSNYQGRLMQVHDLRAGEKWIEVLVGYSGDMRWLVANAFQTDWLRCEGCKCRMSLCECGWYGGDDDEPI